MKQIDNDILNFIYSKSNMNLSAKDIVQGTGYSKSTVCISLQLLCSKNLVSLIGRKKINGFDCNLYGPMKGSHVEQKEVRDTHILSEYWPSITHVPSGYMRKIKGIIHSET